jgi:flagellar hook-associated protein 1 FlgK
MSDIVRILDIARQALQAHQSAMNTASNNIANVNTPGYSRQRINLSSSKSVQTQNGPLGTGVRVDGVERIRDAFIDKQLLNERPSMHQFRFESEALHFIEEIFNEPSDFGLTRKLEDFFNSFHDLANDPESAAVRTVVREKAVTLTNGFQQVHRQLSNYRNDLNFELEDQVNEINRIVGQVANINQKVVDLEVNGHQAAGLRDQRDKLVDELAELVDVQTYTTTSGAMNVYVGGRYLVTDSSHDELSLTVQSASDPGAVVTFARDGAEATISDGSLRGLLDIRDSHLESYLGTLNELAVSIATEINAIHATGYNLEDVTGINFFDTGVSGADDFEVAAAILSDSGLIATSAAIGEPGNNNIARAIADLQDVKVLKGNTATFNDFYNSLLATVGSQTLQADFQSDSFELTVQKLEFSRDSVSAVSLDEEMTHLIEAQTAFTAASRVVTTVNEMTNTILSMV